MTDLPPLLWPETLAPYLGMRPDSVRALIRRGILPAAKVGRRYIVRRAALLAFLERGERARRAPAPEERDAARILLALPPPRRARRAPPSDGPCVM